MTIETWEFFGALILIMFGIGKLMTEIARLRDDLDDCNRELDEKLEEMYGKLYERLDEVENSAVDPNWRKGPFDEILGRRLYEKE